MTEDRIKTHTETWRVAVCDKCGKRQELGQIGPEYGDRLTYPPDWMAVYDGPSRTPSLVFCSTACLKSYSG